MGKVSRSAAGNSTEECAEMLVSRSATDNNDQECAGVEGSQLCPKIKSAAFNSRRPFYQRLPRSPRSPPPPRPPPPP